MKSLDGEPIDPNNEEQSFGSMQKRLEVVHKFVEELGWAMVSGNEDHARKVLTLFKDMHQKFPDEFYMLMEAFLIETTTKIVADFEKFEKDEKEKNNG